MPITEGKFKDGYNGWKVAKLPKMLYQKEGFEIHYSDDGECVTDFVYKEEDAHLIAAAPELLQACKVVLNRIKTLNHKADGPNRIKNEYLIKALSSIIRKAENK